LPAEEAVGKPSDDDDEPEIEVAALQTPLVRKPRVSNPEVDNVIQSGEIAPRSLIIRSQSQPAIQLPPTPAPAPPPRRWLGWIWLVVAAVPALAVLILTVARPAATTIAVPTTDLEAVAELIGTTIDDEVRAAQVRAETIASSAMLRAGIETDARTLDDMTRDRDVVFPIAKTESIEVIQIHDGARVSLLKLQQAAPVVAPARGSSRLELRGAMPTVVVDVAITGQNNAVAGELVLSAPIDLARIKSHLPPRAVTAGVLGFPTRIALVGAEPAAGPRIMLPIHSTLISEPALMLATVVAAAPIADQPMWYRAGRGLGAALAALFVVLFLISLLTRQPNG
jgi:hypothetical protein